MTKERYEELCDGVSEDEIGNSWYILTERIFKKLNIRTQDDFVVLVACAYSWMPTIPNWNSSLDWPELKKCLGACKSDDDNQLQELLEMLVPVINNSITGVSKVLHFIYPEHVPIIDSNVVRAWRHLFFSNKLIGLDAPQLARLPSNFGAYGQNKEQRSRQIKLFIQYRNNVLTWARTLGGETSIRDIDRNLYLYGKQLSKKKKNLTSVM